MVIWWPTVTGEILGTSSGEVLTTPDALVSVSGRISC